MKCVCGYEQGYAWVGEDPMGDGFGSEGYVDVNPDGDKFRKIKGYFNLDTNDSWSDGAEVRLYSCPECGTIKAVEN